MVAASVIHASEQAGEHAAAVPGWVFGGFAFVALLALLVVTVMIKQEPSDQAQTAPASH